MVTGGCAAGMFLEPQMGEHSQNSTFVFETIVCRNLATLQIDRRRSGIRGCDSQASGRGRWRRVDDLLLLNSSSDLQNLKAQNKFTLTSR